MHKYIPSQSAVEESVQQRTDCETWPFNIIENDFGFNYSIWFDLIARSYSPCAISFLFMFIFRTQMDKINSKESIVYGVSSQYTHYTRAGTVDGKMVKANNRLSRCHLCQFHRSDPNDPNGKIVSIDDRNKTK